MIETVRPWAGLVLGLLLIVRGTLWILHPQASVGVGMIPAKKPRTVRAFGIFVLVVGLLNAGLNLSQLLSE